ncbi:MAG: hypothetical protein WC505_06890 [Patescibacteria group bacterium]
MSETALSGLAERDITRYLEVVKLTLQRFMEECLGKEGQFREFFDRFASFTTGFIVNETLDRDPNKRHLQIARYFDDIQERPPQIFIQDNGYNYQPSGLGGIDDGWNMRNERGQQVIRVADVVTIPCQITCAALSEQDINNMAAFISAAFGQFQQEICKYILKPKPNPDRPAHWEVRLPFTFKVSPKKHESLHEDTRQQLWSVTADMDVVFENSVYMIYANQPKLEFTEGTLGVSVPSTIRLGQNVPINLTKHPPRFTVYTDDPRVAVVHKTNLTFSLQPRRPGTCTLFVTAEDGGSKGPRIFFQQTITVVSR